MRGGVAVCQGELDRSSRLLAGPTMITFLRKLLELAPERERFANDRAERVSKQFGFALRNNALGTLACLGYCAMHPPSKHCEKMHKVRATAACHRWHALLAP